MSEADDGPAWGGLRSELAGVALLDTHRVRAELSRALATQHKIMAKAKEETRVAHTRVAAAKAECAARVQALQGRVDALTHTLSEMQGRLRRAEEGKTHALRQRVAERPGAFRGEEGPIARPSPRPIPPDKLAALAHQALTMLHEDDSDE